VDRPSKVRRGVTGYLSASIRGIGQDDFAFNLDPGVGVYVDGVYYARTVGANQNPLSGSRQAGDQRCAPSASPAADSSVILSSCWRELIAPICRPASLYPPTQPPALSPILACAANRSPECSGRG